MKFKKEKVKIKEKKEEEDFELPFFWVTLAEEEKHILDNGPDEDAFLTAVEKGWRQYIHGTAWEEGKGVVEPWMQGW